METKEGPSDCAAKVPSAYSPEINEQQQTYCLKS